MPRLSKNCFASTNVCRDDFCAKQSMSLNMAVSLVGAVQKETKLCYGLANYDPSIDSGLPTQ